MAQIQCDSELMTNYVAAQAVPAGSHFTACLDPVSRRPMVFALSSNTVPKLQVIKEDSQGVRQLIDLSTALNIPVGLAVQAFDVQQSSDLTIYIAFAVAGAEDDQHSVVTVVKPVHWEKNIPVFEFFPSILMSTVHDVFIAPPAKNAFGYPQVLVTHQPDGRIVNGSDITRVMVDASSNSSWTLQNLALPTNADAILSIAPAASAYGTGLFVLYTIQDTTCLLYEFVRPNPESDFPSDVYFATGSLQCPNGATRITSILEANAHSALIISHAGGLQHLSSRETVNRDANGTLISTDPLFQNAQTMFVSQDSDHVSLWAVNDQLQLGYMRMTLSTIGKVPAIPLLSTGDQASSFAACISGPHLPTGFTHPWQFLITDDEFGNLSLLQQCADTGLWRNEPFYISNSTENVAVHSYTLTIHATNQHNQPVAGSTLFVKSSSSVTVILNGKYVVLSTHGAPFTLGSSGELSFIVACTGIAGQTLEFSHFTDSNGVDLGASSAVYDPSRKAIEALGNISDLSNAVTQAGKPLYEPGAEKPSQDDLNQATKCLKTMHTAYTGLPADGSKQTKSDAVLQEKLLGFPSLSDIADDAWNYVKDKVHEATDWVVNLVEGVYEFACNIAGEVMHFVLDCVEKIGEAMTWVWNKIKLGIEKLIELLGFWFNWNDILRTKDTISGVFSAGLDYASSEIDTWSSEVDSWFTSINSQLQQLVQPSSNTGSQSQTTPGTTDVTKSTAFNWTQERMTNGGMSSSTVIHAKDPSTNTPASLNPDPNTDAWSQIQDILAQTGKDIVSLFTQNGSVSASQIFEKMGVDILSLALTVIKPLVKIILKGVAAAIRVIKDLGNASIDIPIFSTLYRWITGHDLTLFDCISLLIAIPTTIVIKIITGEAPPTFDRIDQDFLRGLISTKQTNVDHIQDSKEFVVMPITARTLDATPPVPMSDAAEFGLVASGVVVTSKAIWSVLKVVQVAQANGGNVILDVLDSNGSIKLLTLFITAGSAMWGGISGVIDGPPGLTERLVGHGINFVQCMAQALTVVGGSSAQDTEQYQNLNLVGGILRFALFSKVYDDELNTPDWIEYDTFASGLAIVSNTLTVISTFAEFVAVFQRDKDPPIAVQAVEAMVGTAALAAITDTAKFAVAYDHRHPARLLPP